MCPPVVRRCRWRLPSASHCTLFVGLGGPQAVPLATLSRATLAGCMCGGGSVCRRKGAHTRCRPKVLAESDPACHCCACGCYSNCCCWWWCCFPPVSSAWFDTPCGGRADRSELWSWHGENSMTAAEKETTRGKQQGEMKAPCPSQASATAPCAIDK